MLLVLHNLARNFYSCSALNCSQFHLCTVSSLPNFIFAQFHLCTIKFLHKFIFAQFHFCKISYLHNFIFAQFPLCTISFLHNCNFHCSFLRKCTIALVHISLPHKLFTSCSRTSKVRILHNILNQTANLSSFLTHLCSFVTLSE